MGGILGALNSGKTSLLVNQKAIEVAGNNIANVNTPGYSRQKAELSPYPSLNFGGLIIGQGSKIIDIVRQHDVFITRQVMDKNKTAGLETGKSTALSELENVMTLGDDSLSTSIDRFFQGWQDLTIEPGGAVERQSVIEWGNALTQTFNDLADRLDALETHINDTLSNKIDGANSNLNEIATLNKRIIDLEVSGQTANGLRDRRDQILEELSFSLGANYYEEANGAVSVDLPGGVPLVQQDLAFNLQADTSGGSLALQVKFGEVVIDVNTANLGGEFRGLFDTRDGIVTDMQNDLDTLAYDLADAINTQHQAGTGLDGTTNRVFFTAPAAVAGAAKNLSVAISDTDHVAAGTTDAPGDARNAQLIFDLRDDNLVDSNTYTFTGFYGKMAAESGQAVNQNTLSLGGAEDALSLSKNLRDTISGVSVEEEMVSLIQFQRGFQASAQYLSTIDTMLDTLLTIKR